MLPSLIEFLEHIQAEINFLLKHSEGLEYDALIENQVLNKAFVRSLEIIGEASKKVPDDIRVRFPAIDWRGFAGLRDVLINHYWGIDYELMWGILQDDIPFAKTGIDQVIEILKQEHNE